MKKTAQSNEHGRRMAGRFLLVSGVGALLFGCTSLGPKLTGIRGERLSAGAVEVTSIQVRADKKGGILVLGDVRSRAGYLAPIHSHLDVYALDGEGRALAVRAIRYFPSPIPRVHYGSENHASYSVQLMVGPAVVKTVRVAHHQSSLISANSPRRGLRIGKVRIYERNQSDY